ncbi:MAG: hypothetical protein JW955_22640 [Sedimentisphaerales bacterium]|nr:hypothetical protein [Sedimentisphaerales bacterium]
MEASNLQKRIAEHHAALAALSKRVDQVIVGVETLTLEARESLAEYQEKKRQAGNALSTASRKSLLAQRAFGRTDDLLVDVTVLRNAHIALSDSVNSLLARNDSPEARQVLREFMKTRRAFQATYQRIERYRREARLV